MLLIVQSQLKNVHLLQILFKIQLSINGPFWISFGLLYSNIFERSADAQHRLLHRQSSVIEIYYEHRTNLYGTQLMLEPKLWVLTHFHVVLQLNCSYCRITMIGPLHFLMVIYLGPRASVLQKNCVYQP